MNDLSMCLFPLDDGDLINVKYIVKTEKANSPDRYIVTLDGFSSKLISKSEYERLKQLYCPPTQTIL